MLCTIVRRHFHVRFLVGKKTVTVMSPTGEWNNINRWRKALMRELITWGEKQRRGAGLGHLTADRALVVRPRRLHPRVGLRWPGPPGSGRLSPISDTHFVMRTWLMLNRYCHYNYAFFFTYFPKSPDLPHSPQNNCIHMQPKAQKYSSQTVSKQLKAYRLTSSY